MFDIWVFFCFCRKWLFGRKGVVEFDLGILVGAEEGWIGMFNFVKEEKDF